jgi:ATP-dependent DNA ligase
MFGVERQTVFRLHIAGIEGACPAGRGESARPEKDAVTISRIRFAMPVRADSRLQELPTLNPTFIEPMECVPVPKLPDGAEWLWEIKLDGYRAIAVKAADEVTLYSRRGKSLNKKFGQIAAALSDIPAGTILDGELVALDDNGRPNFHNLQNFRSEASRVHYYIFDLVCCNNRDLTRLPLLARRGLLKSVVTIRDERIRLLDYFESGVGDILAAARENDLEGVVGKRKDSVYEAGLAN